MIYFQILFVFLKVGTLSFGGGAPMIAFFHSEIISNNWEHIVTDYSSIVAIAQLLPGPFGIDASVYIGYRVGGGLGILIAAFAISLPAFLALLFIERHSVQFRSNQRIQMALGGLRPIVIGLLVSAAYSIQPAVKSVSDLSSIFTVKVFLAFIVGYILLSKTKISPMAHFSLFAVIGMIFF